MTQHYCTCSITNTYLHDTCVKTSPTARCHCKCFGGLAAFMMSIIIIFFLCCSAVTTAPVHRRASRFVQEAQSGARRPDGREGCKQQRPHQGDPARREGGGCSVLEDHPVRGGQRHQVGETPEGQKAKCKSFLLQPSWQQFFQQIICASHNNSVSNSFDFLQYFFAAVLFTHVASVYAQSG